MVCCVSAALVLACCSSVSHNWSADKKRVKECVASSVVVDAAAQEIRGSVLYSGSLSGRNGRGVMIYFTARFQVTSNSSDADAAADPQAIAGGVWQNGALLPGATSGSSTSGSLGGYFDFGTAKQV